MGDPLTPTQNEVWGAVVAMLRVRQTVSPAEVAPRVYRARNTVHYFLRVFVDHGMLEHVPSGDTGKRGRYRRI